MTTIFSSTHVAAVSRLKMLRELDYSGRWTADIGLKVFHDLDILLFESRLTGNVNLTWATKQLNPNVGTMSASTSGPGEWFMNDIGVHEERYKE